VASPSKYHGRSTRSFGRLRERVLSQSNICWLCGQPGADTIDHIVPLSVAPHLGEDEGNLLPAHRTCNSSKGARMAHHARSMPSSQSW
jgi:5-methylcytosine-specific restriction endonuclease McrA